MKTLRRLCAMFVLTLALTLPAFAGDITTGITASPPCPDFLTTTKGDMQAGVMGEMSTGVTATDSVTTGALNLLQSLLALF